MRLLLRVAALVGIVAVSATTAAGAQSAGTSSVRRLEVAIVLYTSTFARTLTIPDIERVHDEVVEFVDFYRRHAAGRVEFAISLVQIDRRLQLHEIDEVEPGRYYLSRADVAGDLAARGFRGKFDQVIALYPWNNANPDRALQAFGGGAVGPDGQFLGDAGFNSIAVFGSDPGTIGQILIHETLHNLDNMFARSGLPDAFLDADEMSRNMSLVLAERPGLFLPRFTDADMLAYARREAQGREAYPWAMKLQYFTWMLERTLATAWRALRYGRLAGASRSGAAPLYGTIYTSAANDSVYVAVLGPAGARIDAGGRPLTGRTFSATDSDGSVVATGSYAAGWVPMRGSAERHELVLGGPQALRGVRVEVVRQRVAAIVAEPLVVRYIDWGERPRVEAAVRIDRCCGDGQRVEDARIEIEGRIRLDTLDVGAHALTLTAALAGYYVHAARQLLVLRRSWSLAHDGPVSATLGAPFTINAFALEDRGRSDVAVTARIAGREVLLAPRGDGRFSANLPGDLPPGLHWAYLRASVSGSAADAVTDSVPVYVRPAGWMRAEWLGGDLLRVRVVGRMGAVVRGAGLPLVALAGDVLTPLVERDASGEYEGHVTGPATGGARQVMVVGLIGDLQGRVVDLPGALSPARAAAWPAAFPVTAAAVRMPQAPTVDGDLADWPPTAAAAVALTNARLRFGWSDSALYVAGDVEDDSVTINLVFDMANDDTPLTYPKRDRPGSTWQDDDYWIYWRVGEDSVRRTGREGASAIRGARLATVPTARGWRFEAAIPQASLPGFVPAAGQVARLQVFVTDGDGERAPTKIMWAERWPVGPQGLIWDLATMGVLVFVDALPR